MAPRGTIWLKLSYFVSIGHILPHLVLFRYPLNQLRQGASLQAWPQGGGGATICLKLFSVVSIGHILPHLVLFCLIKSSPPEYVLFMIRFFSWSIKVGQNCRYPPNQFHQGPSLQGWPQGGTIWFKLSYFVSIGHILPHLVLFRYPLNQLRQGASM